MNSLLHIPSLGFLSANCYTYTNCTACAHELARQHTHTHKQSRTMLHIEMRTERAFFSLWVRNGEDTVVLLFCCPVFFSSFIQSCKAAVCCHQSQSVCTSCAALIGCNDLRMSLHTLICFSLWPICFSILPWAAGCLPWTHRRDPPTLHSLHTTLQPRVIIIPPRRLFSV